MVVRKVIAVVALNAKVLTCKVGVNVDLEAGISQLGDRKSTRLNSSHVSESRMPSSA